MKRNSYFARKMKNTPPREPDEHGNVKITITITLSHKDYLSAMEKLEESGQSFSHQCSVLMARFASK